MGITTTLLGRSDYMVVGFCDDSCGNLDLALFDSAGVELQADRLEDD